MAQQVEAQLTPSKKFTKKSRKRRSGKCFPKFPRTRLLKEDAERAHEQGCYYMDLGEEPSGSGDSTEKHHQEKCLRARAGEAGHHRQGLAMIGREYVPVDAEARAKLFREGGLSGLAHSPWEIDIHVTVSGYSQSYCWNGPLLASNSPVSLHGF